ncbi:MAG: FkbM family methyltransferase [Bacteroidota bacterium]
MLKNFFKKNSHNNFFKAIAGFGRSANRFYENRNHDIQTNGELTILKKLSTLKPTLVIDGGANIGKYSAVLNEHFNNCKIYAFEPVKDTFDQLQKNIEGIDNIITINKGLYHSNCEKKINLFDSHTHSSIYDIEELSDPMKGETNISLINGDDFMKENNIDQIDFLKLDLEGAEYDAIIGFEEAISKGKIKAIQFEYGYINIITKKLLIDFYHFFNKHGYILGKIFPKEVEFRDYELKYEDFIGPNFVAVKETETELIELLKNK